MPLKSEWFKPDLLNDFFNLILTLSHLTSFRTPAVIWLKICTHPTATVHTQSLNQSSARTQNQRIKSMCPRHHLSSEALTPTWVHVKPSWPRNSSVWSFTTVCLETQTWAITRAWPSTRPACSHPPTPLRVSTRPSLKPVWWSRQHAKTEKVTMSCYIKRVFAHHLHS